MMSRNAIFIGILFLLLHSGVSWGIDWTQSDWAGGAGQTNWANTDEYLSDDDNVDVSTTGMLLLETDLYTGDGSDGDVTISTSEQVVNTYSGITLATTNSGQAIVVIQDGSSFSVGDEILIIQTQEYTDDNTSTAGTYEFAFIQGISSNTLTLTANLSNSYYSGTFDTQQADGAQVVHIPHYNNLTINGGASISGQPWDGTTGGIVAFRVKGTLTATGATVLADTLGFRGGEAGFGNEDKGYEGEGILGKDMSVGDGDGCNPCTSNPTGINNGGSGGFGRSIGGNGGGGGGHASTGQNGGANNVSHVSYGGIAAGSDVLTTLFFGGGGGGGGDDDNKHSNATPGNNLYRDNIDGGRGGGIVIITAQTIDGGTYSALGQSREFPSYCDLGAAEGSGGAGGTVWVQSKNVSSVTLDVSGGDGENDYNQTSCGWGGDGANGRMRLQYLYKSTITNSTNINGSIQSIIEANINVADSAEVISSILDIQSLGSLYGPKSIAWDATLNGGSVKVFAKTATSTGGLAAKLWNEVISGGIVDYATDINFNDRYMQYKVKIYKSFESPEFTEVRVTLGADVTPPPAIDTLYLNADTLFTTGIDFTSNDSIGWSRDTNFPSGVLTYQLLISRNALFNDTIVYENVGTANKIIVSALTNLKAWDEDYEYYFGVRAVHPDASTSAYTSLSNTFILNSTNATPVTPTIYTTQDTVLTATQSLTYKSWDADSAGIEPDILTYHIEMSTQSNFGIIVSTAQTTGTSITLGSLPGLTNNVQYYYRIWAIDDSGAASAKTAGTNRLTYVHSNTAPPAIDFITYPSDDEITSTEYITWNKSIDPEGNDVIYHIEIRNSSETTIVLTADIYNDTTITLLDLIDSNKTGSTTLNDFDDNSYKLRIQPEDIYTFSAAWSDYQLLHFNSVNDIPTTVSISVPQDSARLRPPENITWSASFHSDQYEDDFLQIQLAADAAFSSVISSDTLNGSLTKIPFGTLSGLDQLTINNLYYLRIKAYDASGNDNGYTASRSFIYSVDSIAAPEILYYGSGALYAIDDERLPTDSLGWSWSRVYDYGYLNYRIQIDSTIGYSSPTVNVATLSDTIIDIQSLTDAANLKDNTFYYWRVQEIDTSSGASSGYTSLSSRFYYNKVNDTPTVPTNLYPPLTVDTTYMTSDSIFRFKSVDADSLGNSPDAITYTLELALTSNFNPVVASQNLIIGDSIQISNIPGLQDKRIYYWRVFATDNHGASSITASTGDWIFYNQTNATPPQTVISTAIDSAVLTGASTLIWNPSVDADGHTVTYNLEFFTDTLSVSKEVTASLVGTGSTLQGILDVNTLDSVEYDNKEYFLRINVQDQYNAASQYSPWYHIFVNLDEDAPTKTTITEPEEGGTRFITQPIVVSTSIDPDPFDTLFYVVEVSPSTDFTSPMNRDTLTGAVRSIELQNMKDTSFISGVEYYTRAIAFDKSGLTQGYSDTVRFIFTSDNDRPILGSMIYPLTTTNQMNPTTKFTWGAATDPENTPLNYQIIVVASGVENPKDTLNAAAFFTNVDTTVVTIHDLRKYYTIQHDSTYDWYMRAFDAFNMPSEWSSKGSFVFQGTTPPIPSAIAPKDTAEGDDQLLFSWNDISRDSNYALILGSDDYVRYVVTVALQGNFTTPVLVDTIQSDTTILLGQMNGYAHLQEDNIYQWKIQALGSHGLLSSANSVDAFFFNLGNQAPYPSDSLSFGNGDSLGYMFEEFHWRGSDPDIYDTNLVYEVWVSDEPDFNAPYRSPSITDREYVALNEFPDYISMIPGTNYYWKVKARDSSGEFTHSLLTDSTGDTLTQFIYAQFSDSVIAVDTLFTEEVFALSGSDTLLFKAADYSETNYTISLYNVTDSIVNQVVITPELLAAYRKGNDTLFIAIQELAGDSGVVGGQFYYWDISTATNTSEATTSTTVNKKYFYIENKDKGQNGDNTTAFILAEDTNVVYTTDSLFNVVIPKNSFDNKVALFMQEVPVDSNRNYDTLTNDVVRKVDEAYNKLSADRSVKFMGQKVYELYGRDLVKDSIIQPNDMNLINFFMQLDSIYVGTDTSYIVDRSDILHIDTNAQDTTPEGASIPDTTYRTYAMDDISIYWLDEKTEQWVRQNSGYYDDALKYVENRGLAKYGELESPYVASTQVEHFSIYTIMAYKLNTEPFGDFLIYPSPIIVSSANTSENRAKVSFNISTTTEINIRIYSRTGRLVWKFDEFVEPQAGVKNEIIWDGKNQDGYLVGNGYYTVKLRAKPDGANKVYKVKQLIAVVK